MIGKLVGAAVGRRLASGRSPLVGALIGAAVPWVVRRAFTPLAIAGAAAFAAKKLYDKKQERDRAKVRIDKVIQSEPATAPRSATPPQPIAPTSSAAADPRPPAALHGGAAG